MMRKVCIYFIIGAVLCTSGCYSFRKKFVRKRKYEKEAPIYVHFKDYPTQPSREAYINYYIFVRGWLDELTRALKSEFSFKKQKRAIAEAIMNLEQIISFYDTQGKEKAFSLYEEFVSIREEIERTPNMSQMEKNYLIEKIGRLKRKFETDFNYSDAESWLKEE